jgi:hypothetical protein
MRERPSRSSDKTRRRAPRIAGDTSTGRMRGSCRCSCGALGHRCRRRLRPGPRYVRRRCAFVAGADQRHCVAARMPSSSSRLTHLLRRSRNQPLPPPTGGVFQLRTNLVVLFNNRRELSAGTGDGMPRRSVSRRLNYAPKRRLRRLDSFRCRYYRALRCVGRVSRLRHRALAAFLPRRHRSYNRNLAEPASRCRSAAHARSRVQALDPETAAHSSRIVPL